MNETKSPAPQPAGEAAVSKHTPGPWTFRFEPYPDGTPYAKIDAGTDDDYYSPNCAGFRIRGIIQISDTRLIAAAPDLLAALLSLVNVAPENGDDDDDPQQAAAWNAARAAIAKATGDAP